MTVELITFQARGHPGCHVLVMSNTNLNVLEAASGMTNEADTRFKALRTHKKLWPMYETFFKSLCGAAPETRRSKRRLRSEDPDTDVRSEVRQDPVPMCRGCIKLQTSVDKNRDNMKLLKLENQKKAHKENKQETKINELKKELEEENFRRAQAEVRCKRIENELHASRDSLADHAMHGTDKCASCASLRKEVAALLMANKKLSSIFQTYGEASTEMQTQVLSAMNKASADMQRQMIGAVLQPELGEQPQLQLQHCS